MNVRFARRAGRRPMLLALLLVCLGAPRPGQGYAVQTHEQLVDLAWEPAIVPLLRARYPGITPAELTKAHAFAYGGCAIQDVGYYPFGNEFFSDLTHYVRSGDFIRSLLRNAKTANELAFAVGAMSHYVGDNTGHALATNPTVAREFPKLYQKFGPVVTYDENPHAHVRAEFAFDIEEISKHRFAPSAYLRHVGFDVAGDLLDQASFETYGLRLVDILGGRRRQSALRSYRFAARGLLPRVAYAENVLHRHKMPADVPSDDMTYFQQALAQSEFENGWNPFRKKPGIGTYTLAGLIFIVPKLGPLALLAIKVPDSAAQQSYVSSVVRSIRTLDRIVGDVQAGEAATIAADLPNRSLDTGEKVKPGGYRLTDETYAKLLDVVVKRGGKVPAGLVADLDEFYADPAAPIATKRKPKRWAQVQHELIQLHAMETVPEP